MGFMVHSLLWVMQDLYHQPYQWVLPWLLLHEIQLSRHESWPRGCSGDYASDYAFQSHMF